MLNINIVNIAYNFLFTVVRFALKSFYFTFGGGGGGALIVGTILKFTGVIKKYLLVCKIDASCGYATNGYCW